MVNINASKRMNKSPNASTGFTLIEILVALSIIAIALGALVKAGSNHANSAGFLKNKTLAHYVAMNEIALLHIKYDWPALGKIHKSTQMAGHKWFWTRQVKKLIDPVTQKTSTLTRQVQFTVYRDADREYNLIKLTAYISSQKPRLSGPASP